MLLFISDTLLLVRKRKKLNDALTSFGDYSLMLYTINTVKSHLS